MKTRSLTSLAVALLLCTSSIALGQTAVGTTVNDAGAAVSAQTDVDAAAGATVGGTTAGVTAGASASADMSLDTNGDGTVDEAETAAGAANADSTTQSATDICSNVDLTAMDEAAQADAIAAATSAQVLRLTDCEDGSGGSLSAEALAALTGNAAISRVLEQETVGAGEILAVSVDATSATIYVRDENEDDTSETTTAQ